MQKKKLIIFMPSIEGGGVEKNLFIISNFLAKKINNIILITYDKKYRSKLLKKIKVKSCKTRFKNPGRKLKYFLCLIELFKFFIKNQNYVLFSFQANLYCALICLLFPKVKLITRSNSSPSGWSHNYFKIFIFKILFKRINKILVNSLDFKKEIDKKFNINSKCIYNPLNTIEIKKKSKEKVDSKFFLKNTLNIINIGRLVDQKNQITLLKSLNLIKNKIHFRALIIGSGSNEKYLKDYIQFNKLNKIVKIIPFSNNPYKYLSKANLLVHTAKYEGLPNILLEAQVLKKYIISTNCPTGPREILCNGKAGSLVGIGDFKKIANEIIIFNNKKKIYQKKIKFGTKQIHRFSAIKCLKLYENEIKKLF